MVGRIIQKTSISPKLAKDLIMTMAIWGNDYHYRLKNEREVVDFYAGKHVRFKDLIQQCRTYPGLIPFVENGMPPTSFMSISGGSGECAIVDLKTGENVFSIEEEGELTILDYWGKFHSADHMLNQSIESASFQDFQNALINGIASIESYINSKALEWNRNNPTSKININSRLSLDEKIDQWIPILLNGKTFEKGHNKNWSDYKLLKPIRDDVSIHPKKTASGISYRNLVKFQNLYRSGIAGLLIDLHKLFNERMPAKIIRRYYAPDTVYLEDL